MNIRAWADIGLAEGDDEETRLRKRLLVTIAASISALAVFWVGLYAAFSEFLAAAIPGAFIVVSLASIAVFAVSKRYRPFRTSQLLLILILPFLLTLVLGGFVNASVVVLWSLLCPLGALVFADRRQALGWFAGFCLLVVAIVVLGPSLRPTNRLPPEVVVVFFAMNLIGPSAVAMVVLYRFVSEKNAALTALGNEQEKSERLLLNVLPAEVAAALKRDGRVAARQFDSASVLFADVVGFTPLSASLPPAAMVELLNDVFSYFDTLVGQYGLEKIRTIGDNYMVAAGVPRERPDHAEVLAAMALDMLAYPKADAGPLRFRIGINSGPLIAGVVGSTKFHYDVWGDAVNVASRMESHGVPGKVQIGAATHGLIRHRFHCTPRGAIEIKGKGVMETWFLDGPK